MSYYSNHESEAIAACHFADDPSESYPVCTCEPEGFGPDQMCAGCQDDYQQWCASLKADLPLPSFDLDDVIEIYPEPCNQLPAVAKPF